MHAARAGEDEGSETHKLKRFEEARAHFRLKRLEMNQRLR
jgi:hypothetical protein